MKLARAGLALPLLVVIACGGAEPARSPDRAQGQDVNEPRTVEEALDQIAEAQAQLGGGAPTRERKDAAPRNEPTPAPPPPPPPPAASRAEETEGAPTVFDACQTPCRAFASMKRAVEALCRLAGDSDDRCLKARRTLDDSTSRVASCHCT